MGIIAGALSGLGGAVQNMAAGYIEDERKVDVAKQLADMQEQMAIRAEGRRTAADKDMALWKVTDKGLLAGEDAALAQRLKTTGAAQTAQAVEQTTALGKLQDERNNDPKHLAGLSKVAAAQHIESQASMAQAALARLNLTQAEEAARYQRQLADARASGNEEEVQKIQQRITDLAFKGKDTAEAYKTWNGANTKLLELETKLSTADAATATALKAEIENAKAIQARAAQDLGVKMPKPAAPQPSEEYIKMLQRTGDVANFEKRFGPGSAAPYLKKGAPAAGAPAAPTQAKYGILSGPRLEYLQMLQAQGKASPTDLAELAQLEATKGDAWFRGRATAEDSRAGP
jgi:myosin heavy subunit